jgi:ABC-type antimicrobial peptide transport system permease subunit
MLPEAHRSTLVGRDHRDRADHGHLGGFFGVLALVIASLGLFGVLAFHIARRTHELGVRMALGASRPAILGLVLRDIVSMVVGGMAIGAGAAFMLTGLASSFLFDLRPNDPAVFLVAGLILATVAVVAGWLPAHRASHVDPLLALRHE